MRHPEHEMQVAFFKWVAWGARTVPLLKTMFAIPNAARRSPRQGAWMKAEGMKAGVWDCIWPVPKGIYHSLFIEFKAGKNDLTEAQIAFRESLKDYCKFVVCRSWKEAAVAVTEYLRGKI